MHQPIRELLENKNLFYYNLSKSVAGSINNVLQSQTIDIKLFSGSELLDNYITVADISIDKQILIQILIEAYAHVYICRYICIYNLYMIIICYIINTYNFKNFKDN